MFLFMGEQDNSSNGLQFDYILLVFVYKIANFEHTVMTKLAS